MAYGATLQMVQQPAKPGTEIPFEEIFQKHHRLVASALRITIGSSDELEDLVQVAFMEVYKSLHRFEGRSALSTWVYRIAIRVGLQHRRKKHRLRWLSLFSVPERVESFPGPHPVATLESREALRELDKKMEGLTEAKRMVFALSDIHGLTHTEVGQILDINPNTVRSRLHAARTELLTRESKTEESS